MNGASGALTYAELDARANQLAHYLRLRGVAESDLVGVYAEQSTATIAMLLGVLKAGAAFVALDRRHPPQRQQLILRDAGIGVVLTNRALAAELPAWCLAACPDQDSAEICGLPETPPAVTTGLDSLAYVGYTSGSTGLPKGVCVPHRAVLRLVVGPDFITIRRDDVFLQFAPLAFDASTLELWGPLLNGARLVVPPAHDLSLTGLAALALHEGVTILWLTAGLFQQMTDAGLDDLRGLRYLLAGGDVLSVPHVRRAVRALPDTILVNGYGPTENTTFTCCYTVSSLPGEGSVPIGRPIRGTEVHVLDGRLQPVADGVAGELYAAGAGLAHGYLGSPGLTAERFIANPFATTAGERMYRTGDLVRRLPGGALQFLGRSDSQVKIRGFRVELGEVEAVTAALPEVGEAAVVAQRRPSGERWLIAYIVGAPGAALSPLTIRDQLAEQLPAYAVPALIRVVDRLPLTANGKVDRPALEAQEVTDRPELGSPYRGPSTARQRAVAQLWSDHLGIVGVGADDDFFELGGHSLLAVTILEHLHRKYGVEVSPLSFYLDPTPSGLASAMESAEGAAEPTEAGVKESGQGGPADSAHAQQETQ